MSDETPTERFEPVTTPQPTVGASASAGASGTATEPHAEAGSKRGMLIALIAVAAAILIALVVLIVVLVGNAGPANDQPTPEASASESESPTPTPEETESPEPSGEPSTEPITTAAPPPPPAQSPSFATFTSVDRATCPDTSSSVATTWSWSSTDAVAAWFGIGTNNAKAEPFESVPTTATYAFNYQCSEASQRYTVTLEDSAGRLTHKTVDIVRQ